MMSNRGLWIGAGTLTILVIAGGVAFLQRPARVVVKAPQTESPRPPEAVAALGRLRPLGEIRRLAAPFSGFGGTPRVSKLLVNEGEAVARGQVLAVFDNRPQIEADLEALDAQIRTAETEITLRRREVARYAAAAKVGAAKMVILEEKQDELTLSQRKRIELIAERRALEADLIESELRSPIDGTVLRLHSRVGERPGAEGVLEVGASQSMEALIEVYESDINRIAVGDPVTLVSENGGFDGRLMGRVERISPQVRQREVLSTNPTGDADARVVEVQVSLDRDSARRVESLAGLKVIARFKTS